MSGSDFIEDYMKFFTLCTIDKESNNNNSCTKDLYYNNVCTYGKLSCSECDDRNISAMIRTYYYPYHYT